MTLTLPPDTETRLRALAAGRRQTPDAVIDALIARAFAAHEAEAAQRQKAGDDLLAALQANNLTFQVPEGFEKVDE